MDATSDVRCICAWDDAATAFAEIPSRAPHVVLIGSGPHRDPDFDCIVRLRRLLTKAEFMVYAVEPEGDHALRAFAAGATGCLSRRTPPEKVLAAVRNLHGGGSPLSPDIAALVVGHIRWRKEQKRKCTPLSPRQERILASAGQGLGVGDIAAQMGLRPETVRSYLKLIYRKLSVHNRTEAVMRYFG